MSSYFDPAFQVTVNGAKLAADVSKNVMQLSVTQQLDRPDSFNLTLANPYPEMRWTHTGDSDLFKEGGAIKIELGYVDQLELMFDGEITSISPTFPASGTPTLGIQGYSRMHRLMGSAQTRTFQDATDTQIVQQIAGDAGLTAECEDTETTHPYVIQCGKTDMVFLREMAESIRFELVVEGKKLIFRKPREAEAKACTLVWGHPRESFAPGSLVVPLKSFNPRMNTVGQPAAVNVRGHDGNKQEIVGRAGSGDEDAAGGGETGADATAAAFGQRREQVQVASPVASQAEADQRARADYNRRSSEFVEGSAATFGVPYLRAGRKVEIQGIGKRFSGEYYVTRATHSLGGGGYQTNLNVRRGALG